MENCGAVQQKISCIFETAVLDEQSSKREHQQFKVVATDTIKQGAIDSDIYSARATEKLDGTCCYIAKFEDKPWLWARFDRKPNKGAEKRFKKFQSLQQKLKREAGDQNTRGSFPWDFEKDFKDTPPYWIPASGVELVDGSPVPDEIGHTPGWVPISPSSRQYCWHLSAVDLENGVALVLRESQGSEVLFLEAIPLSDLEGKTAELIGTNINGNPYGIGSKKNPLHMLVVHGSISIRNPPNIDSTALREWFQTAGDIEGIVWHCANKSLFKLHRNHIGLPWPISEPALAKRRVEILVDTGAYEIDDGKCMLVRLSQFNGHVRDSLKDVEKLFITENSDTNGT